MYSLLDLWGTQRQSNYRRPYGKEGGSGRIGIILPAVSWTAFPSHSGQQVPSIAGHYATAVTTRQNAQYRRMLRMTHYFMNSYRID